MAPPRRPRSTRIKKPKKPFEPVDQNITVKSEPEDFYDDVDEDLGPNPWAVVNLNEFLYYNCPQCNFRSKDSKSFLFHALKKHSKVRLVFL